MSIINPSKTPTVPVTSIVAGPGITAQNFGGAVTVGALSTQIQILNSFIPIGIAPSGSCNTRGIVTFTSSFNRIYNSPGIALWYPATAAFTGGIAGYYYTVMTSVNSGTIRAWSFSTIPYYSTGNVLLGSSAVVRTTSSWTSSPATLGLNAGPFNTAASGVNSVIKIRALASYSNSSNTKTFSVTLGGASLNNTVVTSTSGTGFLALQQDIGNCGSRTLQTSYYTASTSLGTSLYTPDTFITTSVDTSTSPSLQILPNISTAGDWAVLEYAIVETIP